MREKIALIIVLFLFYNRSSFSAENINVNFEEILKLIEKNNHQLKADESLIESSKYSFEALKRSKLPQVSGQINSQRINNIITKYNQISFFGQASLATGNLAYAPERSQKEMINFYKSKYDQSKLNLLNRAYQLYMGILLQLKQLELIEENIKFLKENAKIIHKFEKKGALSKLNYLNILDALNKQKANRALYKLNMSRNVLNLKMNLGISKGGNLTFEEFKKFKIFNYRLKIKNKYLKIPKLESYDSQIQAAEYQRLQLKGKSMPTVNVFGGYVVDQDPTALGNYWKFGLNISIPIFNSGNNSSTQNAINLQKHALREQKEVALAQLHNQQDQYQTNIELLKIKYKTENGMLKNKKKIIRITKLNYKSRRIQSTQLITSMNDFLNTKLQVYQTKILFLKEVVNYYIATNQISEIKNILKI